MKFFNLFKNPACECQAYGTQLIKIMFFNIELFGIWYHKGIVEIVLFNFCLMMGA